MSSQPEAYHVLAKPTGAICNLDCKYCFFLSKGNLYPGDCSRMSDETMESYIRQLLEPQQATDVTIAWQGGEPTLMGLDFFRRSIEVVAKYRKPGAAGCCLPARASVRATASPRHPRARRDSTICAQATSCSLPMSMGR